MLHKNGRNSKNTKFNKQKKSTGAPIEVKHHNSSRYLSKNVCPGKSKTDFFLSGTLSSIMFLRLEKTMLNDFVLAVLSAFVKQGLWSWQGNGTSAVPATHRCLKYMLCMVSRHCLSYPPWLRSCNEIVVYDPRRAKILKRKGANELKRGGCQVVPFWAKPGLVHSSWQW